MSDTGCLDRVSSGFKDDIVNGVELLVSQQDWEGVSNNDPVSLETWASSGVSKSLDLIELTQKTDFDIQSKINSARKLVLSEFSNPSTMESTSRRDILESALVSLSNADEHLPTLMEELHERREEIARLLENQVILSP